MVKTDFPILEAEKYFDTVGGIYYFSDFWTYSDSGKILGAGYTTGFKRENLPTVYETVLRRHEILRQELNKEATCSFYSFNKGEGETQMSFSQLCELMRQGRRGAHILYWDVEDMEVFLDMIFRPDSDIIEMKMLFVMLEEGKGRIGKFNEEMMRHEWHKKEEQDVMLN